MVDLANPKPEDLVVHKALKTAITEYRSFYGNQVAGVHMGSAVRRLYDAECKYLSDLHSAYNRRRKARQKRKH